MPDANFPCWLWRRDDHRWDRRYGGRCAVAESVARFRRREMPLSCRSLFRALRSDDSFHIVIPVAGHSSIDPDNQPASRLNGSCWRRADLQPLVVLPMMCRNMVLQAAKIRVENYPPQHSLVRLQFTIRE